LARLEVDLIVARVPPAPEAAQRATSKILTIPRSVLARADKIIES
jgi:hypothetical protein